MGLMGIMTDTMTDTSITASVVLVGPAAEPATGPGPAPLPAAEPAPLPVSSTPVPSKPAKQASADVLTWSRLLARELKEIDSPYAEFFHEGLEVHFDPVENDDDALDQWGGQWPIPGDPHAWTVPHAGATAPENNDTAVNYHPKLVLCSGTSWWNYLLGITEAVMFDFDLSHGAKGLDEDGIAKIDALAQQHPAIMATASKGGGGRHWLVFVEPMPAKTRGDHKRNGDAVMAELSRLLGVDIKPLKCSHAIIQYVYHRAPAPGGFRLIKRATAKLKVDPLPPEPEGKLVEMEAQDWDETHRAIFTAVRAAGYIVEEKTDGKGAPLVELHTAGLLADFTKNRRTGLFSTVSTGKHSKPNAYAYALSNGALSVFRHNQDEETEDWFTTSDGKVGIKYNYPTTFDKAVPLCGQFDRRGNGILSDYDEFARLLGLKLEVPPLLKARTLVVRREGRNLFFSTSGDRSERDEAPKGWRYYRGKWEADLIDCLPEVKVELNDDTVRQTTTEDMADDWVIKDARGNWISQSLAAIKTYLKGGGHTDAEVAEILREHMENNYQLQRIPFAPEYSPGRLWNRYGAKLACEPVKGEFPHIQGILDNWGKNLTAAVLAEPWCQAHGITTGAAYLKLWSAVLYRHPDWRLPYLFGYSTAQNIGKSTFPRMLTRGIKGKIGGPSFARKSSATTSTIRCSARCSASWKRSTCLQTMRHINSSRTSSTTRT